MTILGALELHIPDGLQDVTALRLSRIGLSSLKLLLGLLLSNPALAFQIQKVTNQHLFISGECSEVSQTVAILKQADLNNGVADVIQITGGCRADIIGLLPSFYAEIEASGSTYQESNCWGFAFAARKVYPFPRFLNSDEISRVIESNHCQERAHPVPGAIGLVRTRPSKYVGGRLDQHAFIYLSPNLSFSKPRQGAPVEFEVGPLAGTGGPNYPPTNYDVDYYFCEGPY
ncbi:MAG: hypothetical protein AB7G93_12365 [Bdellovibrionales bacterium]